MLESSVANPFTPSIRLLASDIDGTLLNPQFQISDCDLAALRQAHDSGIEIVLVTAHFCPAHCEAARF
jgi:hydroxymethylpyrimidine pyrophosphatase-like HAD family hydrolase